MNLSMQLGDPVTPKKPKAPPQVGVKFHPDDLKKLDELVADQVKNHVVIVTGSGTRHWQPSRSSAVVHAVRVAWNLFKTGKSVDARQVDIIEAIERSPHAAGVDAVERSQKKLARKFAKKKKPRPAPRKKLRSAKSKKPRPARASVTVKRSRKGRR